KERVAAEIADRDVLDAGVVERQVVVGFPEQQPVAGGVVDHDVAELVQPALGLEAALLEAALLAAPLLEADFLHAALLDLVLDQDAAGDERDVAGGDGGRIAQRREVEQRVAQQVRDQDRLARGQGGGALAGVERQIDED